MRAALRRHLTILFSDLSGSVALAGSMEPEHYLEVLDHLKQCAERVVPRHGGIVLDFHGDGFMAMFGYPEPSEHDGRRAVEAALDLHAAIPQMPSAWPRAALPVLALHSGVHAGLVLLVENDPSPGRYALIGEAPSVAARLSDLATRNEILVSATTLGGESHFFDVRARGEVALQGRAAPIAVLDVVAHSPVNTRFEARVQGGLTPFVGRAGELALLESGLRAAAEGRIREVVVVAPAGVGKTRLVEEFLRRQAPHVALVCRGYCESDLGAEPLQPFLQMLRQLARHTPGAGAREEGEPEFPEVQQALSSGLLAGSSSGGPGTPGESVRVFRDLFAALAARGLVVVFIDDWQWADDATKQILVGLRELADVAVLVVLASRVPPELGVVGDVARIELTPFGPADSTTAIRTLQPNADPFTLDQIQQLSGGNVLFIEELCHWSSRDRMEREVVHGDSLPAWLSTLIESRVAHLPVAQADLVRAAAVIGVVVPCWLLEQVTGIDGDDHRVRQLAERDLIFPGEVEGTLRFKHVVTRDVIYASVGLREREVLHRRIADLLERRSAAGGQEMLEALSYHFRAGVEPERAAHYAELAGDKALSAAAPDRARSQYAAALTALDLLQASDRIYRRWSAIAHRLGLACVFDPTRDQLAIFHRALELARARSDDAGLARAEYWIGFIHYAHGELTAAITHYEASRIHCLRALDEARRTGHQAVIVELDALAVQLLATLGQARAAAGEHAAALGQLDEALAVKRRHRRSSSPAVGSAYTLACKGAVLGDLGRFAEAQECFGEALEAIRAGHFPVESSILAWHSAVYLWQGRWHEARETAARAEHLAQRVGSFYVLAMGQNLAAYATWLLDGSPESVEAMVRATSWLEARDKRLSISTNYGWLAHVMAREGRVRETRAYAARAVRRARVRDASGVCCAYRALAELPWPDRPEAPDRYVQLAMHAALERRSPREEALTLLCQSQRAAAVGRRVEALSYVDRATAAFTAMNMAWHTSEAARLAASLET